MVQNKQVFSTMLILAAVVVAASVGCGVSSRDSTGTSPEIAPPTLGEPIKIEESDLYQKKGDLLYVQNPHTGLNIIDVSDPLEPKSLGQAPVVGKAGELYLREKYAIVLLETATQSCRAPNNLYLTGWQRETEVVLVDVQDATAPSVIERYCMPGTLVDSRMVNDFLFIVTAYEQNGSRAFSLDLSVPKAARVVQHLYFPGVSKEINVTPDAIYVAGQTDEPVTCGDSWCESYTTNTHVQYVEISPATGMMTRRGSIVVEGEPQGRFHMDARDGQFRIVTYNSYERTSSLYILDVRNPDEISVIGKLDNIGYGERLYATRFDGDRAYVVTFRQNDPLWIVDLKNPAEPTIVGALHVPGWSDFIFPRGDKLLCVGRGDFGQGLGVSLFDVSDPSEPWVIDQIQFGYGDTVSEANVDHRAVTIVDNVQGLPLLIVPYAVLDYHNYEGCDRKDLVQLVQVDTWRLKVRGAVEQQGTVRRTMLLEKTLLSISDYELLSVNLKDLDNPAKNAQLTIGNQSALDPSIQEFSCYGYGLMNDYVEEAQWFPNCNLGPNGPTPPSAMVYVGMVFLVGWIFRRQFQRNKSANRVKLS
ncbi:MAG: beta-propeller domain-containing protein [Pseudomonadota bacterium]